MAEGSWLALPNRVCCTPEAHPPEHGQSLTWSQERGRYSPQLAVITGCSRQHRNVSGGGPPGFDVVGSCIISVRGRVEDRLHQTNGFTPSSTSADQGMEDSRNVHPGEKILTTTAYRRRNLLCLLWNTSLLHELYKCNLLRQTSPETIRAVEFFLDEAKWFTRKSCQPVRKTACFVR